MNRQFRKFTKSLFLSLQTRSQSSTHGSNPISINFDQTLSTYLKTLSQEHGHNYNSITNPVDNKIYENSDDLKNTCLKDVLKSTSSLKVNSSNMASTLVVFPKIGQEETIKNLVAANASLIKQHPDHFTEKLKNLNNRANQIDHQLKPLEEKLNKILLNSSEKSDNMLLLLCTASSITFVSMFRLTFWEFSWEVMEPVAWAAQSGSILFWCWYYFVTKSPESFTDLSNRVQDKSLKVFLEKGEKEFDVQKFNALVEERRELEKEYRELRARAMF